MELMAGVPDKHFDLSIVDIPYGLGDKLTQGGTWASKYKKGDADWDILPTTEYFKQLFRVSKNQIIWGGNYADLPPARCFLIWDKVAQMETMADCEYAWTSFNKNAKIFRHVRNTNEKRIHITQKPIKLYSWILKKYAICSECNGSGEIPSLTIDFDVQTCKKCKAQPFKILDTHFGSGSIALAVHKANQLDKANLHLTACEIDKDYIDAAIKRIKNATIQQHLF